MVVFILWHTHTKHTEDRTQRADGTQAAHNCTVSLASVWIAAQKTHSLKYNENDGMENTIQCYSVYYSVYGEQIKL